MLNGKDTLVPTEVKKWADELIRVLEDFVKKNATSLPQVEGLELEKGGVEWRIVIVGNNFQLQKKVTKQWQADDYVWPGA